MMQPLSRAEFDGYAALVAGSTLLQRAIERNLQEQAGITQVQFEILMTLHDVPEGLRMAELADRLIVSRSGLTYQVKLLERSGYLVREKHGSDERGIVARITETGESLRARVMPGHVALVREALLAKLTPAELAAIADGLGRVAGGLR